MCNHDCNHEFLTSNFPEVGQSALAVTNAPDEQLGDPLAPADPGRTYTAPVDDGSTTNAQELIAPSAGEDLAAEVAACEDDYQEPS